MNQVEKAKRFGELHIKGNPLVLYNAWDAGSAKAIRAGGAKAVATSSWAVAAAQGYRDGEDAPLDMVLGIYERIVAAIDAPVTVDFEGGYSEDDTELAANIGRLLGLGAIGINFEDRVVRGQGLYNADRQAARIKAIRQASDSRGIDLYINARTDLFLGSKGDPKDSVGEAIERGKTYAAAGASGLFIPGLVDDALIRQICDGVPLPVNVMVSTGVSQMADLAALGVARVSYGNIPYTDAMAALQQAATAIYV
jgi:2-methylisocitrate lyase-like PEP mutase family enzyme